MLNSASRMPMGWIAYLMVVAALAPGHAFGQEPGKVVPARAEMLPLDEPIALLQEAKRNYTVVKDYSCMLVSQERVKGELQDVNYIDFKMKTQPFSVYMRWADSKKFKGQEVAFVAGRNNNKMRVKSNVLGGGALLGWMSIDVNDPRVLQNSRHTILEAGLGNMIEQNLKHWESARRIGKSQVNVAPFKYNNRDCIRIEVAATDRDGATYCYRSVIYLEKESKIPIRMENFDWPRPGGPPGGELLEMFSYVNLRFNTGLRDEEFIK